MAQPRDASGPPASQIRVVITNKHGEKLVGLLHQTGSNKIVVLCHGFISTKNDSLILDLAAALTNKGISVFRFDFSGNGESEGEFEYGNYRKEADDLHSVVSYLCQEKYDVTAVVGHSKGGDVVVIYASIYDDVRTIINLSGRFDLKKGIEERIGEGSIDRINKQGYLDVKDKSEKVKYRVTKESLMERLDTDMHAASVSISQECRFLTVHGSADETIPVEDAFEFAKLIPNHKLQVIEGANHNYTAHRKEVADTVVEFITSGGVHGTPRCFLKAYLHRYNAIACGPEFAARHWQLHSPYLSGGVFLRHVHASSLLEPTPGGRTLHDWESFSFFLASSGSSLTSSSANRAFFSDFTGLLPSPNPREMAYLQLTGATDAFIVHSSAGLLLCCRGRVSPVHHYACDPVALRWMALPELPRPPAGERSGVLSVDAGDDSGCSASSVIKRFQVVLFDQRRQWDTPGGCLELEVFSSDSGEWTAMRLRYPSTFAGFMAFAPSFLGQSGTAAYWLGFSPSDKAVAYSSVDHSLRLIPVPGRVHEISAHNRCTAERRGGGLRYAHFDAADFEVWDLLPGATPAHRASVKDAVQRSPGARAFCRTLGWLAVSPKAFWRGVFELIGFDPADEDVFFFQARQVGRLAAYSMRLRKLSFVCQVVAGVTFTPFDMFPYARPPGPVHIPGMQYLS
ncbi:hypothetical protein ACP70R_037306 [Stipagrostis hirtigluma subsp. patula]